MVTSISKSKSCRHKGHQIKGGADVQLYVEEAGNPKGRPILFLHGFSQHRLCWIKQLDSTLADDFRLLVMDLRGHGASEKPQDGYTDSCHWADDLHAVITTLGLTNPIISAWSYGGIVLSDYLRIHGDNKVGGIQLVGAHTKWGGAASGLFNPYLLALGPDIFSDQVSVNVDATQKFIRLLSVQELSPEEFHFFLGCNLLVPPHVRKGLLSRDIDNDDLWMKIRKPVLITHGQQDAIVKVEFAKHHSALLKQAKLSLYDGVGHMPFWEATPRFNRELRAFVNSC